MRRQRLAGAVRAGQHPPEVAVAGAVVQGIAAVAAVMDRRPLRRLPGADNQVRLLDLGRARCEGLAIDAFSQERINVTLAELQGEQDGVKHLL